MNKEIENREVKQYLIVRTDLDVCCGKLIAQAAHATMKVFFDKMKGVRGGIGKMWNEKEVEYSFVATEEEVQWIDGQFTKITKKVKNENQLLKVYNQAKEAGLNVSLIKDAGLFGLKGENYTVVAVGPNYVEDCKPIVGKLRLLNDLKKNEK